ncbi:MAG: ATP-binding protein [Pseudomonadales bacterium]|nr:ATP-binding protein [Pseudomonadales bacterium]
MIGDLGENLEKKISQLLDRLLKVIPTRPDIDWKETITAVWAADRWGGAFEAIEIGGHIDLDDLLEIDRQKEAITRNTEQFCMKLPANNVLLWGARGTGKTSLIQGLINRYAESGLRLVQVDKASLMHIADIVKSINRQPYRFIISCDDLSFDVDDSSYKELKSLLEGSVIKSSENVLVYATSNRRHLLAEHSSDNEAASYIQGELHESEAVEEKISLSDRFGLWLSFYPFKQDEYLRIVKSSIDYLAKAHKKEIEWSEDCKKSALSWALARGVRSGRTAHHFARDWVGKELL